MCTTCGCGSDQMTIDGKDAHAHEHPHHDHGHPHHHDDPHGHGRSVSLDHAAQLLGVSRRTIYNRIREGRLQTIRTIGGSQRVLLDSVQGHS